MFTYHIFQDVCKVIKDSYANICLLVNNVGTFSEYYIAFMDCVFNE